MTEWGVIPSIRVPEHGRSPRLLPRTLEFTLDSGGDDASNSSLTRGDAHVMIEMAADLYGDEYNAAIRERLRETFVHRPVHGGVGPHRRFTPGWKPQAHGSSIRSPYGRGVRSSSRLRITKATG